MERPSPNRRTWPARIAQWFLSIFGWKIVGDPAPVDKCVVVVAYHTSNWDAFPCLMTNLAVDANASWFGKHTLFWWPQGALLRAVGGIPIHRDSKEDTVTQMVAEFQRRSRLIVAMAPEGTRKRASKWKSGFYHIALKAHVPMQPAALDYKNRQIVFGPLFDATGDIPSDLRPIREFFRQFEPKCPENADKDFTI